MRTRIIQVVEDQDSIARTRSFSHVRMSLFEAYKSITAVLFYMQFIIVFISVADPDPPDPRVFGPPGSGPCKNSKKNLDSYYFVNRFEFLSLKNDVNLASKSHKQKKLC